MRNNWLSSRLAITVLLIIPIFASVEGASAHPSSAEACQMSATPTNEATPSPVPSPAASPSSASPEFDQLYLDLMIVQQGRVADLARIGTLKANTRELQQLSEEIVSSTEATLEHLRASRVQFYDAAPLEMGPELMGELDAIGRQQPGAGGVPGAMEIVAGINLVEELCTNQQSIDRSLTDALIEQLDAGIVLSGVAKDLAVHDETKAIAVLIVDTDRPFEDGAIAIRDGILAGTPVATPSRGGL